MALMADVAPGPWRNSRWLAVGEPMLVVLLVVADIHRLIPLSKTPFYLVLGWASLRLRGRGGTAWASPAPSASFGRSRWPSRPAS
jgi:hypothetical protein